jgi:hypothetical protein
MLAAILGLLVSLSLILCTPRAHSARNSISLCECALIISFRYLAVNRDVDFAINLFSNRHVFLGLLQAWIQSILRKAPT